MDQQLLATFKEIEEEEEKFKKEIGRGSERKRGDREKIEFELSRKNEAKFNKLLLIHHTCSNKKNKDDPDYRSDGGQKANLKRRSQADWSGRSTKRFL